MKSFISKTVKSKAASRGYLTRAAALLAALVLLASVFSAPCATAADTYKVKIKGVENYIMAFQVLDLVNEERVSQGLGELEMDKGLLSAAMLRSAEQRIVFSHTRPNGKQCFSAFEWEYCAGENIAYGYISAQSVFEGWMNSEGHRENILTAEYTKIGIGCFSADGTLYWTQVFSGGTAEPASRSDDKNVTKTVEISGEYKDDYVPAGAPRIVSVTDSGKGAVIKWRRVSGATGYRVYKYNEKTKKYALLAGVSASKLSYTDKKAAKGKSAKYKVRAYTKSGCVTGWSSYSAEASITLKPAKVKITSASSAKSSVTLGWSGVTCTGYKIYRYNAKTKKYTSVANVKSPAKTCTVTGLSRRTSYKFKVRAYVKSGGATLYGPYSEVKTVRTR